MDEAVRKQLYDRLRARNFLSQAVDYKSFSAGLDNPQTRKVLYGRLTQRQFLNPKNTPFDAFESRIGTGATQQQETPEQVAATKTGLVFKAPDVTVTPTQEQIKKLSPEELRTVGGKLPQAPSIRTPSTQSELEAERLHREYFSGGINVGGIKIDPIYWAVLKRMPFFGGIASGAEEVVKAPLEKTTASQVLQFGKGLAEVTLSSLMAEAAMKTVSPVITGFETSSKAGIDPTKPVSEAGQKVGEYIASKSGGDQRAKELSGEIGSIVSQLGTVILAEKLPRLALKMESGKLNKLEMTHAQEVLQEEIPKRITEANRMLPQFGQRTVTTERGIEPRQIGQPMVRVQTMPPPSDPRVVSAGLETMRQVEPRGPMGVSSPISSKEVIDANIRQEMAKGKPLRVIPPKIPVDIVGEQKIYSAFKKQNGNVVTGSAHGDILAKSPDVNIETDIPGFAMGDRFFTLQEVQQANGDFKEALNRQMSKEVPEFKDSNHAIAFGRTNTDFKDQLKARMTETKNRIKRLQAQGQSREASQQIINEALRGQLAREALEAANNPKELTPIEKLELPADTKPVLSVAVGTIYGMKKDEKGNWIFDPTRAIIGGVAGAVVGSVLSSQIALKRYATALGEFRSVLGRSPQKDIVTAKYDAVDNESNIFAKQQRNSIELDIPSKLERQAATLVYQANGDFETLRGWANRIRTIAPEFSEVFDYAANNVNHLKRYNPKIKQVFDAQYDAEKVAGIDTDYIQSYIPQRYEDFMIVGPGAKIIKMVRGGGIPGASRFFTKPRVFDSYADAITSGFKPRTLDVGELAEHRLRKGQRLLNQRQFVNEMKAIKDPLSAEPLMKDGEPNTKTGALQSPKGYVPLDVGGTSVYVNSNYQDLFHALFGQSALRQNIVGRGLLSGVGTLKHGLLLFDTFHASRILQKEFFGTGQIGYKKGLSILEYTSADLDKAVKAGDITQSQADFAKQNRPIADLLIKNGLNVGKIQEGMYRDIAAKIPWVGKGIGKYNDWLFEKMIRGAMMQSGVIEYEKNIKRYPELAQEQIARKTAKDMNEYFGNLGRQGLFKSQTFQDIARVIFLAPQWVESMARSEVKGYRDIAKAPLDAIRQRQIRLGTMGTGLSRGVMAYFVANQLVNLATKGRPTWMNEDGHKLDAWIPNILGKEPGGFYFSPLAVSAELSHDALRYSERFSDPVDVASVIAKNKLSPFSRAVSIFATGKDFQGRPLETTWDKVKNIAVSIAPIPLASRSFVPLIGGELGQGTSAQRQLLSSFGIKVEPESQLETFRAAREREHIVSERAKARKASQ